MPGAPQPAPLWDEGFLESMRAAGDTPADELIATVFDRGDVASVNALMANMVRNEDPDMSALPPALRRYFEQTNELPAWADPAMIEAGERVFWRYGPRIILVLHCYSLPFCYLGRNGVQVLALTARLTGNAARRVIETAQMLVDVLQPGGLTTPRGRGRRTIQKVRLMHAAIRRLVQAAPTWKQEFGLPVNQEDIAGTLMSFSWITLDGLRKLGINIPPADQLAYIHFWQVVGYQLGLRDDLNPGDIASAAALADAIAGHQFAACDEGKLMTAALIEYMERTLPGNLFDRVPALLLRYFLGRDRAAMLGVQENWFADPFASPLRLGGALLSDVLNDNRAAAALAEKAGQALIRAIVFVGRGGNRPSFRIPDQLRQVWGVNWT